MEKFTTEASVKANAPLSESEILRKLDIELEILDSIEGSLEEGGLTESSQLELSYSRAETERSIEHYNQLLGRKAMEYAA